MLLLRAPRADVLSPTKMNYEIHGNTIPHLHMHLFPRTAGEVYVGYVIHHRVEFEQSTKDLEDRHHHPASRGQETGVTRQTGRKE